MIYLASPYWHSDPAIRNQRFRAACRATAELIREGFIVFSPVVYGHALTAYGLPGGWSFWEPHDNEHLSHCEEVVVLRLDGWRDSEGVQAELDAAAVLGKPVRYIDAQRECPGCGQSISGQGRDESHGKHSPEGGKSETRFAFG